MHCACQASKFRRCSAYGKLAALASPARHRYHAGMSAISPGERPGITWFVSRHPGAIDWARQQNLAIARWVAHLDPAEVQAGDTVIGTLPVNLAAEVCRRGARYLHLSLAVPAKWRGRELSADDLLKLGAHIEPYRIEQSTRQFSPESV